MITKTIFITGAGSGIGKDAAFALAKRGHHVIAATHTQQQSDALAQEATQNNLALEICKLDITIDEDRALMKKYFDVDVLINNAAIGESGSLVDIDMSIVRKSFETNLFSSLTLTQIALGNMRKRESGTVIFISSTAGRVVMPFLAPYAMTKFALSSGAEALRSEMHMRNKNIHVSLVEPGAYHTGFNQRMIASQQGVVRERLELFFKLLEVKSTQSIVRAIIRAAESKHPRLRYVAPWWQALGVRVLRILGR